MTKTLPGFVKPRWIITKLGIVLFHEFIWGVFMAVGLTLKRPGCQSGARVLASERYGGAIIRLLFAPPADFSYWRKGNCSSTGLEADTFAAV
jgi:hypothetical protein